MIEQFYPNPKNKKSFFGYVTPAYTPPKSTDYSRNSLDATWKNIGMPEWYRRNALIKDHAKTCGLKAGDVVMASTAEGAEKYGECKVIGVTDSYLEFREKDWPTTDCPHIVTVYQLHKTASVINATYDYFSKVKETT